MALVENLSTFLEKGSRRGDGKWVYGDKPPKIACGAPALEHVDIANRAGIISPTMAGTYVVDKDEELSRIIFSANGSFSLVIPSASEVQVAEVDNFLRGLNNEGNITWTLE